MEASRLSEMSADNFKSQSNLLTSPQFFVTGQSSKDKSPTLLGELQGTERRNQGVQSGIQTNTAFGVQGRLYFSHDNQQTLGSSFIPVGQESIDLQSYNLELKIPVWQNGFGRDVRSQRRAIQAQAEAEKFQASFEAQSTLQRAETAYYRLAKLQSEKEVLLRLVDQGNKLTSWAKEKVGSRLLEKSNLTESIAAKASRDLELRAKDLEYQDALREFNSLRQFPLDTQVALSAINDLVEKKSKFLPPQITESRIDVKAQERAIEAEKENLKRSKELLKPRLDITGKLASFTKQSDINDTRRCTDVNACSQVVVGLTFEMPLDFSNTEKAASSANQKIEAREAALARARIDSADGLSRIQKSLELIDQQIIASRELLKAQENRLKEERNRQKLGRGSTFDVIRAEQDFSQSELALIQIYFAKLQTLSSLRLYASSEVP